MISAHCWIYKSSRRDGMYLFVVGEGAFDGVPNELLTQFGEREFVMQLKLTGDRHLARADAREVLQQLEERGYYLQMPPSDAELACGTRGLAP